MLDKILGCVFESVLEVYKGNCPGLISIYRQVLTLDPLPVQTPLNTRSRIFFQFSKCTQMIIIRVMHRE